jgi:hypothetical protein
MGVWAAWSIAPSSIDLNVADLCLKAANGDEKDELGRKVGDIIKTRIDKGEVLDYVNKLNSCGSIF